MGAADVVPLVPLRDFSLAECAALAHRLGSRIGDALALPVYYYEAAATRPDATLGEVPTPTYPSSSGGTASQCPSA